MVKFLNSLCRIVSKSMYLMRNNLLILFSLFSLTTHAVGKLNVQGKLATYSMIVSGETTPLWLYAGQEGRWGISGKAPFLGIASFKGIFMLVTISQFAVIWKLIITANISGAIFMAIHLALTGNF